MSLSLSTLESLMLQGSAMVSEGRISEAAIIFDQARLSLSETIAMSVLGIPMLSTDVLSLPAFSALSNGNSDSSNHNNDNSSSSSSSSSNHGPSSTRQQQQQQQSFPDNGATSTNVALDPLNLPAAALRTAIVQNVEQVEFIPHPNHSFQRPYDIDFFPFPVVIRFIMPQTPSNPAGSSVGFGAALTPAQSLRSSACCLFSLALCYQLNTNSQEKSIVIAMSLYQQAWSCLKDIIIDPSDSSILLSLSISMNMASCAQRLGLLDAARTWNDCMSSLLKLTAPSSEPPSMDDATSCDQQGESATERSDDRTYPSPLTATTAGGYSNPQDSTGRHKSPLSNEVRHFFFVSTVLDGRGSSAATA